MSGSKSGETLDRLLLSLDQASLDPDAWPAVCDNLSDMVGGDGGMLVPYDSDDRSLGMPHSPRLTGAIANYIELGWPKRDFRLAGVPKAIRTGFITDQDIIAVEDMDRHPFYDWLASVGLKWYVGVTFKFDDKIWCAAVNGSPRRGPFLSGDVEKLIKLPQTFALAAKRATLMGHSRVRSIEQAFSARNRGVAAIGALGKILFMNQRAEELLGEADIIRNGYLRSRDTFFDRKLSDLVLSAANFKLAPVPYQSGPISFRLDPGRTLSIDVVPMPRDFQSLLSGVTALLTVQDISPPHLVDDGLRARLKLTGKEFELAQHLVAGRRLADAAAAMGISVATARQHIKSIFSKTGTHRQAELVALLARGAQ